MHAGIWSCDPKSGWTSELHLSVGTHAQKTLCRGGGSNWIYASLVPLRPTPAPIPQIPLPSSPSSHRYLLVAHHIRKTHHIGVQIQTDTRMPHTHAVTCHALSGFYAVVLKTLVFLSSSGPQRKMHRCVFLCATRELISKLVLQIFYSKKKILISFQTPVLGLTSWRWKERRLIHKYRNIPIFQALVRI